MKVTVLSYNPAKELVRTITVDDNCKVWLNGVWRSNVDNSFVSELLEKYDVMNLNNAYGDSIKPQEYDILEITGPTSSKKIHAEHSMPGKLYQFINEIKVLVSDEPVQQLPSWLGRNSWTFPGL